MGAKRTDSETFSGTNPVQAASRALELLREGGFAEMYRGVIDYLRWNTQLLKKDVYSEMRVDNEERWEYISGHIDNAHGTLLDIGCAEGYFTAKAAESGLQSVGIDVDRHRISDARLSNGAVENLEFRRRKITPDTIAELPEADIVLLLTVHHHWVSEFGWDDAKRMVQTVMANSSVLVYEPPGNRLIHPEKGSDGYELNPATEYYRELLDEIGGSDVSIVDQCTVPYTNEARKDPLFVLDTSRFDRPESQLS